MRTRSFVIIQSYCLSYDNIQKAGLKAFGTVGYDISIVKLEHGGIRNHALKLFGNNFENGGQVAKYKKHISERETMRCEVPRESVLGPILFLIYINDIYKNYVILSFTLFDDYTNSFTSVVKSCRLVPWLASDNLPFLKSRMKSKTLYDYVTLDLFPTATLGQIAWVSFHICSCMPINCLRRWKNLSPVSQETSL